MLGVGLREVKVKSTSVCFLSMIIDQRTTWVGLCGDDLMYA